MKKVVWGLAIALAILHQDFWNWDNATLDFGFMPRGLTYHAAFSVVVAALWAMAVVWAWPTEIEKFAEADEEEQQDS